MYLGIDIGGTKTAVASLDDNGVIQEEYRFPTPKDYDVFLQELAKTIDKITTKDFVAAGVAAPGRIDRDRGVAIAFGNLEWRHVPLRDDVKKIVTCPVVIENDANLAGLSEAMLLEQYPKVLYVTVSTGIGTGYIVNQSIDPELADSEGGQITLEHNGKLEVWEDFASGRAIVNRFGKRASEITDAGTWQIIARDIGVGLLDLTTVMQPNVIVLGGGVATHFDRFKEPLAEFMHQHENPLFAIPPIQQAARPEQAVLYGCYDLAKSVYGSTS